MGVVAAVDATGVHFLYAFLTTIEIISMVVATFVLLILKYDIMLQTLSSHVKTLVMYIYSHICSGILSERGHSESWNM